jgi:hypothetical protein
MRPCLHWVAVQVQAQDPEAVEAAEREYREVGPVIRQEQVGTKAQMADLEIKLGEKLYTTNAVHTR